MAPFCLPSLIKWCRGLNFTVVTLNVNGQWIGTSTTCKNLSMPYGDAWILYYRARWWHLVWALLDDDNGCMHFDDPSVTGGK